jgi:uncharacterized membrane protein YkvA (DUF1232 family)
MAAGADNGWWMRLRDWARRMKRDVVALWLAARDPRTPILAKIAAAVVAAYALSPIDLIPDFVPVLGYLDDVIIVPLGIMLALRLMPAALMAEFREAATQRLDRPTSRAGLAFILALWLVAAALLAWWLWPRSAL